MISELDSRARAVFRHLVDLYLETGEPVGSKLLAHSLGQSGVGHLSPASIRNVMAMLEDVGLLYAPHTSAGRLPTDMGLRLFVDGLLEIGHLSREEQASIEQTCKTSGRTVQDALKDATGLLSGLSACAGLVVAPALDQPLKHIEFVPLNDGRALVVLVTQDGQVENRLIDVPLGVPASTLITASNFLAAKVQGRTLPQAKAELEHYLARHRHEIDELTQKIIASGMAVWSSGTQGSGGQLIVRGQAQLLDNVSALTDLERLRHLFTALETYESVEKLLDVTGQADGVKVFIGAESGLFDHAGCSLVVAPLARSHGQVIGAIGVIGPTRLNYARIVPLVDYTARVLAKSLNGEASPASLKKA